MRFLLKLIVLIIVLIIAAGIWIWSGSYNIGADVAHSKVTSRVIHELVDHSVERHARDIQVPNLESPAMIAEGAEHYAGMCTGCHLAPGQQDSEMRAGLYPRPPNLTRFSPDPAEAFWVIKHGIKMSGMPAWGKTHSDDKIWAMVAYLQQQPKMSVQRYQELTANAAAEDMPGPAPAGSAMAPAAASTR
ncbi:MAG TPA: cytochrome c [Rhodanobacteraceae bacterium]|nr:cytochrome c [Rhodanobacteraceae bacterium]